MTGVAIVTGAARGIGAAIARRFAADGWHVVVTDRLRTVRDLAAEIGGRAHVGDVAHPDHVHSVVDTTLGTDGRVDLLVNNAGVARPTGPGDDRDRALADWDEIVGSNLRGAFLFGRAVLPTMIEDGAGHVVNVSTDHVLPGPGSRPHHGHGAMDLYNASKWALNGLTFDWARAVRRHGVRVNQLCLGATDTAMLRDWIGDDPDPEVVATWLRPTDVAQVVADLHAEGPPGRTGDSIGLYAGERCVLPPPGPDASTA